MKFSWSQFCLLRSLTHRTRQTSGSGSGSEKDGDESRGGHWSGARTGTEVGAERGQCAVLGTCGAGRLPPVTFDLSTADGGGGGSDGDAVEEWVDYISRPSSHRRPPAAEAPQSTSRTTKVERIDFL